MAKGFWIAHIDVSDMEAYKRYVAAAVPILSKAGARYLVRNGASELHEGALKPRHVVIEFSDYASALACYRSDEYGMARSLRALASQSDFVVIEGYDGPQP
jgi:uncharacterized protein (DUF1330 family)